MPEFREIRQNPPRAAKSRGMDHCVCCINSTPRSKLARVPKINKSSKKARADRGAGGGRKRGQDPKEIQVFAQSDTQYEVKGPAHQPAGSGPERCRQHHDCGCAPPIFWAEGDLCLDEEQIGRLGTELVDAFNDIPTPKENEEWWDILFEDIGVLSDVQSAPTQEHQTTVEDHQVETSEGSQIR